MGTVNVVLGEDTRLNLILGQQLENAVTSVVFDFSAWQTTYGSGTLALSVQRPGDDQPYAVTMTTSGTDATWSVTNLDTAYKGVGHIQLTYTVGSAIKKSVVYKFTVYESLGANGEYPSPGQTWQEEMEDEIADVKADLNDLDDRVEALEEGGGGSGLTADLKAALDQLAQKVAYIDEDGQTYYDALHAALYPPADLVSISAVYTQSGTVYDTDTLDSLKSDLVVTAHYDNSTSQVVTEYILSGTLTEGTSTITVSYGGKTTTFNVTVTEYVPSYITEGLIHHWDAIDNTSNGHDANATVWEDLVGTNDLTVNNPSHISWESNAVAFDGTSGTRFLGSENAEGASGKTLEVVFTQNTARSEAICSLFYYTNNPSRAYGKVILFSDNTFNVRGESSKAYITGLNSITDFHHIGASYSGDSVINKVYANGVETTEGSATHSMQSSSRYPSVGGSPDNFDYAFNGKVHAIRIYNRILTDAEIAQNYAVDVERFGLGA